MTQDAEKPQKKKKMGRAGIPNRKTQKALYPQCPSYTPELAEEICLVIASTLEPLADICKRHKNFPCPTIIQTWRWEIPEFAQKYAHAKMCQAEYLVDNLRKESRATIEFSDQWGNTRVDQGSVARQQLIVNTDKWLAQKYAPKLYGHARDMEELQQKNDALHKELMQLRHELGERYKEDY